MPTIPEPATADRGDAAAALAAFSDAALTAADERELVAGLVAVSFELLAADQLHLIELSADGAVGHASVLLTDGRPPQGYTMVLDERPSGTAHAARTGEPLQVADARTSELIRSDFIARFDVGTVLFVPLAWSGVVRWVGAVARTQPRRFTDAEVDTARAVLNVHAAGLALLEARSADAARAEHGGALARAASALNAGAGAAATLEVVCREAAVALGADSAGVYLADGAGGGIATVGHQTPEDWRGYRMRPGEGVAGRVLQSGHPAFTNAYQQETELPSHPFLQRLQTAVALPMRRADGKLVGALSLGFARLRRIDAADLQTLEAFADLACVAAGDAAPPR